MSQSYGSRFFRQRGDDARAAVVYLRSLWRTISLSRQRRGMESALTAAQADVGEAAEKAQVGGDLPGMAGVREARTALIAGQAELELRTGLLAAAEEKRRQGEVRHNQIVAPIEVDCGTLRQEESAAASAVTLAQRQISQIEKDIQRTQAMLTAPSQGNATPQPATVLQQQLASLQESLAPARQNLAAVTRTYQQVVAAAEQKQGELNQAKDVRKKALADCDEERRVCTSAIGDSKRTILGCRLALAKALGEFGKAVLEAKLSGAGIDEPVSRARSLMQQIAAVGEQSSQTRAQANANRGAAIRSAATLIVVVLAASLVWMAVAKLTRPRQPVAAGGTTQPAPAATTTQAAAPNATRSTSRTGPVNLKPEDLHPAILAMPSLAVRTDDSPQKNPLFKPSGKITCTDRRPMAGGNETLRFAVEVQSRPSVTVPLASSEMTVEVVVDEAGQVLSLRTTGYTDPDMLEILRNEEARPGRK